MQYLVAKTRERAGRTTQPSYGLIDSQSIKTVANSEDREIDGGKTKGRKLHIVADIMGNLLAITVHAANIHGTKSGILPAGKAVKQYPGIQRFCADAGYRGTFVREMDEKFYLAVDISEKIKPHEWEKLP